MHAMKQRFDVVNHLKITNHSQRMCLPVNFNRVRRNRLTYISCCQSAKEVFVCDCACVSVTPKFMMRYCLTGKACQPVMMVSKGRGYREQIVAPSNSQTIPSLATGCYR